MTVSPFARSTGVLQDSDHDQRCPVWFSRTANVNRDQAQAGDTGHFSGSDIRPFGKFDQVSGVELMVGQGVQRKRRSTEPSKEFIDARCIDHCVGFAKIGNKHYIIDKENAFDDANWENLE